MATLPKSAMSQVTIGADSVPQNFSVLELISNGKRGLRLPQLTTAEVNNLGAQIKAGNAEYKNLARGLTVYDSTQNCVKYWKGMDEVWVGIGCPPPPDAPDFAHTRQACGTIADLEPDDSSIKWYDDATGGTALPGTTPLVNATTYYASKTVNGIESEARTAVTITLLNCAAAPAGAVTTFVKVMYDFQHQTLEAYKTGTADAISFKWQVSRTTSNADFKDIPDALNSKYYTVPAGFYDAASTQTLLAGQPENSNKTLYFRCVLTNPAGTGTTPNTFNIFFINTSGYLTDGDGRKYVTLGKGSGGKTVDGGSAATMQMLLLNLGQSGDSYTPGSSDAGDIGDFYQWGRVADGHQNTVWYKGTDHIDSIGTSAKWSTTNYPVADEKTSGVVAYSVGANTYDIATHQVTGDKVGKFISADLDIAYDWYYNGGHDDGLWGNSTSSHNCRKSC